jgi:hypothetical protein
MLDRRRKNHRRVKPLSFVEIQELTRAVMAAGDSFYCRRLLQRLDREELELHEVLVRLSTLRPRQRPHPSTAQP